MLAVIFVSDVLFFIAGSLILQQRGGERQTQTDRHTDRRNVTWAQVTETERTRETDRQTGEMSHGHRSQRQTERTQTQLFIFLKARSRVTLNQGHGLTTLTFSPSGSLNDPPQSSSRMWMLPNQRWVSHFWQQGWAMKYLLPPSLASSTTVRLLKSSNGLLSAEKVYMLDSW